MLTTPVVLLPRSFRTSLVAVVAPDDDTVRGLMPGGLLLMTCKAKYKADIPGGYTVHKGPVEGCFSTNFIPS
ncbi:hypothetical protein ACWGI8_05820 [Streptomyces sp. NPDC054841]